MAPPALPPALARLASALELSSGFLLYFITGPRDHADSVHLRLLALASDFEIVRHRIHSAADLELAAILTDTSDERPRLVFVSGLETMATASRKEVTERLNLLRDSWAPHPARIVFWLPSWGLGEFRRTAPDLFDWRSGLITLSDADLPIRSELEYLVWTCERYRGPYALPGSLQLSEQRDPPLRLTLIGLDPTERFPILRSLALGFARDALAAIPPAAETSAPPPVPVLVRSQDAAGTLDDNIAPWPALARAAGVPGPELAALVLADLAASGRLLVLLDAFDRLSLAEGEVSRGWLDRLLAVSPPIHLLATTTGPLVGFFAFWPRASFAAGVGDDAAVLAARYVPLVGLLQTLFPRSDELVTLAHYFLGEEIDELQLPGTPQQTATRLVIACARRGLLDSSFFAELTRMRPAHTAELEAIARGLSHR